MTTRSVALKSTAIYDDGSIRGWPRVDDDEREALELTHEPRTVGSHEVYISKDPGEGDAD
jgi:hypothetical protein